MKNPKNNRESAKYAAACAFMLPGICAEVAVMVGNFSTVFPVLLAVSALIFSACVAWKL